MVIKLEPLVWFSDDQLDAALDAALANDDSRVIWAVVEEFDRRGSVLEV